MSFDKKQFAFNAASGWVAQLVFALVGFILMPYIIMRLGEEGYGIYQLARSALVFLMFLQLGMGPTLVRFFAKAIARDDTEELRRVNSTAQFLLGGLGLLGSLICLALIPFFIQFYEISPEFIKETTGLLICMVVSLFLNMTVVVPQALVFGINRYDLANCIEIGSHLMRLVLIVIMFEIIHPSIFFVGLAILLAQLARYAALFGVAIKRTGKAALFSVRLLTKKMIRTLLSFSMLNLANSVAGAAVFQGPVLIIGKVLGEEMVTAFAPVLLISSAMQGFLGQSTRPLVPLASEDRERNKGAALGKWAISAGQLAAVVGFGVALPLATFGPEIMVLWLGERLAWIWPIVAVMATGVAISQVQAANYFLALGGGQIKPTVYSQIVMAIVVITGTLIGTTWLGWHLFTIALYIGMCIFVRNTFYLTLAYSRQFFYSYLHYLWAVYFLPALIATACVGGGWLLKIGLPAQNFLLLVVEVVLVVGGYATLCWFLLLTKRVKSDLVSFCVAKNSRTPMSSDPASRI